MQTSISKVERLGMWGSDHMPFWPKQVMLCRNRLFQLRECRCAVTNRWEWSTTPSSLFFEKNGACQVPLQDIWQRTSCHNSIFQRMEARAEKYRSTSESAYWSQRIRVLYDHQKVNLAASKVSGILIKVQLCDQLPKWQKNNKANVFTRKPNKQPTNNEDERRKHSVYVLLLPNWINYEAELQPIDKNLGEVLGKVQTNSEAVSNASEETSTLLERVTESNQNNKLCNKICLYFTNPKRLEKLEVYLKSLKMENGLLMRRNWLWVANKGQLQLEVIKKTHNQLAVGHPGMKKMLEIAWYHYYWLGIKKMIKWFIRNCHVCKQAKAVRDTYHGLLQPLLVPKQAWINIIMDFVVGLPKCKVYEQIYNAILMVINQLSKKRYYIPCSEEDNRTSAKVTTNLFLQDI